MEIEKVLESGKSLIKVKNDVGLEVIFSPLGAGIYEIRYLGKAMTVASKDINKYDFSLSYYGKTVGRIAGRIPNSQLTFEGKDYVLTPNEGVNCLHGGPKGLSFQEWKNEINDVEGTTAIDFFYDSLANDEGLPGNVRFQVRYYIYDKEPRLRIEYRYCSDEDTPINLTTHTYFNLGEEETIEDHSLRLASSSCEDYDATLIPLGMRKCPSYLDFSSLKKIGQDINNPGLYKVRTKGYDHAFLLDQKEAGEPDIYLESPHFSMSIFTDAPAVQCYSDNYPSEDNILTSGKKEQLHSALAIEPVFVPGDFQAMKAPKGQIKLWKSDYVFKEKGAGK